MLGACPGAVAIKGTPTLKIKECPECGGEIEVFSNLTSYVCKVCGFEGYNDTMSCIRWCKYARDCVGDELYDQFMGDISLKTGS
jgi:anaerobic ribonucleoside-triphosphate reductase